jgi:2-polyprenyl-6-methoxyphenol hydroxylase-like FAD-dependent oxidoreductase
VFAGVRLAEVAAREDLALFVFNPELGTVCALIPQGAGAFRAYLGHPTAWTSRFQGPEQVKLFLSESGRAVPVFAGFYEKARAIGPLACFDGGDSWVDHPYREGVALIGDAAATSDPSFGQGMSLTLRDARALCDALAGHSDWDQAGHRYAEQHDAYFQRCHRVTVWFRNVFQEQGPEADARRQRALPLIMQDISRVPDHLFSGPEPPADDTVRARFFGEV